MSRPLPPPPRGAARRRARRRAGRTLALLLALLPLLGAHAARAGGPLAALAGRLGGLAGTEERLLHRKPAGPYVVTVEGNRLIGQAYLRVEGRLEGAPLPEGSEVELELVPPPGLGAPRTYRAEREGDAFLADPVELAAHVDGRDTTWTAIVRIDGPAGAGETRFGLYLYPPRLEPPPSLAAVSVALPLALLALLALAFAWRRTPLVRPLEG